jgi:hypothetical protein
VGQPGTISPRISSFLRQPVRDRASVGHVITQKALAGSQGLETIRKGHLRRCRRDFMQFSRVLLRVLRKYDVDLRVCRNGDNDTAIGIEVHDL